MFLEHLLHKFSMSLLGHNMLDNHFESGHFGHLDNHYESKWYILLLLFPWGVSFQLNHFHMALYMQNGWTHRSD